MLLALPGRQGLFLSLGLLTAVLLPRLAPAAEPAAVSPEAARFFETRVRPVLVEVCFRCHGMDKHKGDLRLDSRAALLAGGESGPAVVPGSPEKSLLIKAISHTDADLRMPPKKKLPKNQIDDLTQWIKSGAPWPGDAPTTIARTGAFQVTDKDREHWSFKPLQRLTPPESRNAIDRFVLAGLQARGLTLNAPAGKRELIRRVSFDLTGLPPTPEEIDAFVNDRAAASYENLVDRLLASPRYGERWARHWLDVVRFAQTDGYERDAEKPNAWRYRDYVIASLNADKPYDLFVKEQIAGDELTPLTDDGLIATAFFRIGPWDDEPDDPRQAEFDNLDDVLSTTGEAFLGLTIGCARCHDHKFDPIGQDDYYSLLAFYRNVKPVERKALDTSAQCQLKSGARTLAVLERGPTAPPTHVLARGNAATPGKEVQPRYPRVLCKGEPAELHWPAPTPDQASSGRRRVLAEWIAGKDNPLTARVIVNRLWQHHFGQPLVGTPNDFGHNGARPTHPELLDYLASELIAGGWRLKRIHKMILLSATYQQSSRISNDKATLADPDNRLLWRQNLRRLEAEAIRDAILAVNGRLNLKMGGRGIFPTLPPEVLSTQSRPGNGWDKSDPEEQDRRSVYVYVKRTLLVPLLDALDFATPDKSVPLRTTTTIAPQALLLLNSAFMEEQSAAFAGRLLKEGSGQAQHIERAFRLAVGRMPSERERELAQAYLDRGREGKKDAAAYRQGLARLCKLVLNLNEFVYMD